MGLVAGLLMRHHSDNFKLIVVISILTEVIMILGYFLYESLILGIGSGAFAAIPGNCVQGVFAATAGPALILALSKTSIRRIF